MRATAVAALYSAFRKEESISEAELSVRITEARLWGHQRLFRGAPLVRIAPVVSEKEELRQYASLRLL